MEDYQGQTVQILADVLNTTNGNITVQLQTDKSSLKFTAIPYNVPMATYSVTHTIESDATSLNFTLALNPTVNQEYVFTDNWRIIIQ